MSTLPDAIEQNPACGCCGDETRHDGHGGDFICEDCGLSFDHHTLEAAFTDPDTPACGFACDNWWHGPGRIKPEWAFNCGTCQLPAGHKSLHHTDCKKTVQR